MILISQMDSRDGGADAVIARWALAADHAYAGGRKQAQSARNSLLGRALLRRLVSEAGFAAGAEIIGVGKPHIENGPHISISHSNHMVVAAVCANFAIGVDVEYHRLRDFAKLADYAFGPGEIQIVKQEGEAGFFRIWTMREAVAKASGASIFRQMNGKDIDLGQWQIWSDLMPGGYSIAVAARQKLGILQWVDATAEN